MSAININKNNFKHEVMDSNLKGEQSIGKKSGKCR